jgi:diketogulonate reductase-like aldo/keto reductase
MLNRREALQLMGSGLVAMTSASSGRSENAEPTTAVLTRRIPSSGELLPVVGLGTWQTFDVTDRADERTPVTQVLREFSALGGTVVDSSPMYGRSEIVVGDIMRTEGLRPRLFVATKVWTTGKQAGVAQMNDSMRKLGVTTVDLMQVHNLQDVNTHLATLEEWKRDGKVRHIGVTHYTASSHDAVARVIQQHRVDTIQINYSIGEREAERRLLPMALERGVAVIANRPFASGNLFERLRAKPLPSWASEIACATWAQMLLKFVISHPAITCTIPATSKVAHLRDNMAAAHGPLPDESLRVRIAAVMNQ